MKFSLTSILYDSYGSHPRTTKVNSLQDIYSVKTICLLSLLFNLNRERQQFLTYKELEPETVDQL